MDVALTGVTDNQLPILLGNGDGTFEPANYYQTGNFPIWPNAADFNGDGNSDLAGLQCRGYYGRDLSWSWRRNLRAVGSTSRRTLRVTLRPTTSTRLAKSCAAGVMARWTGG